MRITTRVSVLLVAVAGLATISPAVAQPAGGNTQRESEQDGLVSISFPGGPFSHFVDQLEAELDATQVSSALNVLMQGGSGDVPIGPFELNEVRVATAILLATRMTLPEMQVRMSFETLGQAGNPVYFVESMWLDRRNPLAQPEVLVVSLKEITTALPGDPPEVVVRAETVLTAIETSLTVASGDRDSAQVQYHPESGLLVLAGEKRVLNAAERVVREIRGDVIERRDRARTLQNVRGLSNPDVLEERLADARMDLEMTEIQLQTAMREYDLQQKTLAEAVDQVESGLTSQSEIRHFEYSLAKAGAKVEEYRIMIRREAQRTQRMEVALDRAKQLVSGGGPGTAEESLKAENDMLRERLALLESQLARLTDELRAATDGNKSRTGGTR